MTGRPRKWKTVEELQQKIDAYFADCDAQGRPYTVTGLAVALDTTRETLMDYEATEERRIFSDTIKKAKLRIQTFAEESLWRNTQVAGVIFSLKNNYGWRDTQSVEHTGDVRIEIAMVGSS